MAGGRAEWGMDDRGCSISYMNGTNEVVNVEILNARPVF